MAFSVGFNLSILDANACRSSRLEIARARIAAASCVADHKVGSSGTSTFLSDELGELEAHPVGVFEQHDPNWATGTGNGDLALRPVVAEGRHPLEYGIDGTLKRDQHETFVGHVTFDAARAGQAKVHQFQNAALATGLAQEDRAQFATGCIEQGRPVPSNSPSIIRSSPTPLCQ